MYTYTCCRCTKCEAQIVLEDRADANLIYKLPRPRPERALVHIAEQYLFPRAIT